MEKKYVTFHLGSEIYAIDIMFVKAVYKLEVIYRLPNMPESIKGVFKVRNNIVPIVDLKQRFVFEGTDDSSSTVLVVNVNGMEIAIIIDKVRKVIDIDSSVIQPPPVLNSGIQKEYLVGIAKIGDNKEDIILIIDIQKLFSPSEISKLKNLKTSQIKNLKSI
ncbi:MAG: chemotaxis protein CheW [Spirochaetes bacterium]|nr:chemotaxis protein CheW [Spirochaetota bacterium]